MPPAGSSPCPATRGMTHSAPRSTHTTGKMVPMPDLLRLRLRGRGRWDGPGASSRREVRLSSEKSFLYISKTPSIQVHTARSAAPVPQFAGRMRHSSEKAERSGVQPLIHKKAPCFDTKHGIKTRREMFSFSLSLLL